MKKYQFYIILLTLSLVSCNTITTTASFTKTGTYKKIEGTVNNECEVFIFSTRPTQKYEEIGLIEFSGNFIQGNFRGASSAKEALEKSKKIICNQGGNGLLLWEANSAGHFKKATVIKLIN